MPSFPSPKSLNKKSLYKDALMRNKLNVLEDYRLIPGDRFSPGFTQHFWICLRGRNLQEYSQSPCWGKNHDVCCISVFAQGIYHKKPVNMVPFQYREWSHLDRWVQPCISFDSILSSKHLSAFYLKLAMATLNLSIATDFLLGKAMKEKRHSFQKSSQRTPGSILPLICTALSAWTLSLHFT